MEKVSTDDQPSDARPTPDDFINYLPWACNQLQLETTVLITKGFQNEYVSVAMTDRSKKSGKSRIKLTQSRHDVGSDQDKENSASGLQQPVAYSNIVRIVAIYDSFEHLVEIKFLKNRQIPRLIFKIIGLTIQFLSNVANITINSGMDQYTLYEINKFLNTSHITEICLDGSFLKEGNFDILLETSSPLRHYSLCRCKIDDLIVENIARKLIYPMPASKTLLILNLSSNSITDLGAAYLAQALRSNRHLSYLNLADNRLTDEGAKQIFDVLVEFPLTSQELFEARQRHMLYLKHKNELIEVMIKEIRAGEFDRKLAKRKSIRPISAVSGKKSKLDKESSLKSIGDAKSLANIDLIYYEKALNMVENSLGEFRDPYTTYDTTVKDGSVFSKGNNVLCYLNLAYNNLSYLSLKKLLGVLIFQKLLDRKPRGLINLSIEGNNLPVACKEMVQIDDILEMGLMVHNRRLSGAKKKPQSKCTSR
ncbi:uncharacterized protein LOC124540382 [Vanessa cardui]|uniref:uncharacterized protein LOC124540382 n=1 Tax=Vanessa cardui TaxID=171605 RepID=UPI001F134AB2|nr:uncharacterized protein LOC124540382 [Vanessa cardui]